MWRISLLFLTLEASCVCDNPSPPPWDLHAEWYRCNTKLYCDQGTYAFESRVLAPTWDTAVEAFQDDTLEWLYSQPFQCENVKLVGVDCRLDE